MFTVASRMWSSELVSQKTLLWFAAFKFCIKNADYFWYFRVVLHQNERFSEIEEKYMFLHGKTSNLFTMEEDVLKVSKKVGLTADEWGLKRSIREL